ncbi:hypothetical protein FT641_19895 [Bacillus paranthracis]|uniref:metallophosphoesterase n=1 Tax=Bacillus paranthracis TaxID=2026186 RepID=UPI0018794DAB|nr:metallophosphoesterase [Bacillus paranthracis]MBE7114676.1 hypothetical protein [Bacillus paranthracis]MBE7154957.1 hypothetical protein [Bacillus paranthracis]
MKILNVGDLHLNATEMRNTVRMKDNNKLMLKNLIKFIVEDEEIGLVIFEGDLQHKTPQDMQEVAEWRKLFRLLGRIMQKRMRGKKFNFIGLDDKTKKKLESGKIYPVVACRGNHDNEITLKNDEKQYTFFDELLSEGLIINPKGVAFKDNGQKFYIDIRNYGHADRELPKKIREDKSWFVMAVLHDNVLMPESPLWMLKSKGKEGVYDATKVLKGVNIGILGHIHENVDPIYIEMEDGSVSVLWQTGAMGRTSFKEENLRDYGYCGLIDTNNLEEFGLVEIDVIPAEEYFSFEKALAAKKSASDYKDFSLRMETVERKHEDPRDVIRALEDVDDDVKEFGVEVLNLIHDKAV